MIPSRDDAILEEVTRRLVAACHPDRIYLFGSAARGDAGPDSDYDLMIVVPDDAPREVRTGRALWAALGGLSFHADLVVYTCRHFDERVHLKASLPGTVVREGKLLFGSGNGNHVTPVDKSVDTAEWLLKARQDLTSVEALLAVPVVETALYHCQQVAEKSFKALLCWHDVPFRKVHSMKELGAQCVEIDPTLGVLAIRAELLSDYVFKFRYPSKDPPPTLAEGRQGETLAREVFEAIRSRIPVAL